MIFALIYCLKLSVTRLHKEEYPVIKGIIEPLPKGNDLRDPLSYRPISIISIPCKIYANILNKILLT